MAAGSKAKYDPLEAAKLGTDNPKPEQPPAPAKVADDDVESDLDAPTAPRRARYTVKVARRVSIRGQLCNFAAGRIVDSAGYNIDQLVGQGLELELIKE